MCIVLVTYYLTSQWVWLVRLRWTSTKLQIVLSLQHDCWQVRTICNNNKQTNRQTKKKNYANKKALATWNCRNHLCTHNHWRCQNVQVLMAFCFGTNLSWYSIVHATCTTSFLVARSIYNYNSYGNYIIISRMQLTAIWSLKPIFLDHHTTKFNNITRYTLSAVLVPRASIPS